MSSAASAWACSAFQSLDRSRTKQNTPPAEQCAATTKTHKGTSMKLHRNQYCPIHHSRFCCGREEASKAGRLTMGVERIDDPNHPRGYRELRSPAELRKVLTQKILRNKETAESVTCRLPTARTLSPTTSSLRVWERHGAMTTQTTFRRRIGSATSSRVQDACPIINPVNSATPIPAESRMNFLLLILLDISASDDDSPCLSVARRPLEALIADWVRQGEEINLLRDLVAGHSAHRLS